MQPRRPLEGVRVAVTRAAEQCAELSVRLRALGALPVEWPLIAFAPPLDSAPLDAAIRQLAHYEWIVFSSANGVKYFCARPGAAAWPGLLCVAAVGGQTAAALQSRGWPVDAVPEEFHAADLAETMGDVGGLNVLIVRPEVAAHDLAGALEARGAWVTEVPAYRNVPTQPAELLDLELVDVVTFASASAATNFAALLGEQALPERLCIACIGPSTSTAARQARLPVHVEAAVHTLDGLVAALANYFTRKVSV